MNVRDILRADVLSDLRDTGVADKATVFLGGKILLGDSMGGFYRWDASSTQAEDLVNMNYLVSNLSATGRWVRMFQKSVDIAAGSAINTLVFNGNVKTLFCPAVTDANGKCTVNLTMDGTATGAAIFSQIFTILPFARDEAATPDDVISGHVITFPKTANSFKTTTVGFYKGNIMTLAVGLLYKPYAAVTAGKNVVIRIEGT